MREAGGNPNYQDYGGIKIKPCYRLYFNRATMNSWWCFEIKDKLQWFVKHLTSDLMKNDKNLDLKNEGKECQHPTAYQLSFSEKWYCPDCDTSLLM